MTNEMTGVNSFSGEYGMEEEESNENPMQEIIEALMGMGKTQPKVVDEMQMPGQQNPDQMLQMLMQMLGGQGGI